MQSNGKKLLIIFLLALSLRFAWIATLNNTVDEWKEEGVKEAAWSIIEGRGYSMPRSAIGYPGTEPPLYSLREPLLSFFLVPVFFLFGENYLVVKFLLAILGSLAAVLLYKLGKEIFDSEKIALTAAFATAFLPELIYWNGQITPETLSVFVLILPVLFLTRSLKNPSRSNIFLSGFFLALAALTRAQTIIMAPFLLLSFVLVQRHRLRAFWSACLIFLFFALTFSPWIIRNFAIHHRLVVIPTTTGQAFYVANNPGTIKEINKSAGTFRGDDLSLFEGMSEIDIYNWYRREAFQFIFSHPKDYLRLVVDRFFRFWRFYPHIGLGIEGSLYGMAHFWASILTSGVVIMLCVVGGILSVKNWRQSLLLLVLIVSFSTMTILGRVAIRYRLPIMPYVILFASYAFYRIFPRLGKDSK
ncbi:MAG: glycosyltransferase family 39 protein [Candidatus Omnitrophota bacterium]